MPDQELMIWTAEVTQWIEWYEYVKESSSWYDAHCPSQITDSPEQYNTWLKAQKQKEQSKASKPYGRR